MIKIWKYTMGKICTIALKPEKYIIDIKTEILYFIQFSMFKHSF